MIFIAALPVLLLLVFGRRLPPEFAQVLKFLSVPFFIIVGFYSLMIALALVMAFFIGLWALHKYAKHKLKNSYIQIK